MQEPFSSIEKNCRITATVNGLSQPGFTFIRVHTTGFSHMFTIHKFITIRFPLLWFHHLLKSDFPWFHHQYLSRIIKNYQNLSKIIKIYQLYVHMNSHSHSFGISFTACHRGNVLPWERFPVGKLPTTDRRKVISLVMLQLCTLFMLPVERALFMTGLVSLAVTRGDMMIIHDNTG